MFSRWLRGSGETKHARHVDPVCRMRVDQRRARAAELVVRPDDHEYFFCREGCKRAFELSPPSYVER